MQCGEPGELLGVEALLAQRHLPLVVDQGLLAEVAPGRDDAGLAAPARPQPRAEPGGGPSPPPGQVDAETGGRQHGGRLAQERVRGRRVEGEGLGPRGAQRPLELGVEPARPAEVGEQRPRRRRHEPLHRGRRSLARPDLRRGGDETGLGARLQGELQLPQPLRVALERLDEPEARPRRPADHLALPPGQLGRQRGHRTRAGLEPPVAGPGQGDEPGRRAGCGPHPRDPVDAARPGRSVGPGRRQPAPHRSIEQVVEGRADDVRRCRCRLGRGGAEPGRREGEHQGPGPRRVGAPEQRAPHGPAAPGPQSRRRHRRRQDGRQRPAAGRQVVGEGGHLAQVPPRRARERPLGYGSEQRSQRGRGVELDDGHLPRERPQAAAHPRRRHLGRAHRPPARRRQQQLPHAGRRLRLGERRGDAVGVRRMRVRHRRRPRAAGAGGRLHQRDGGVLRPHDERRAGGPPRVQDEHPSAPAWEAGPAGTARRGWDQVTDDRSAQCLEKEWPTRQRAGRPRPARRTT